MPRTPPLRVDLLEGQLEPFRVEMPKVAIPPVSEPYSPTRISLLAPFDPQESVEGRQRRETQPRRATEPHHFEPPRLRIVRKTAYSFAPGCGKSKHPFFQWLKLESSVADKRGRTSSATRNPPFAKRIPRRPLTRARPPHPAPRRAPDLPHADRPGRAQGALPALGRRATRRTWSAAASATCCFRRVPKDFDIGTDAHPPGAPQALPQLPPDRPPLPPGAHPVSPTERSSRSRPSAARPGPGDAETGAGAAADVRQHLRHAARGRAAPRLHDQRPLLRHLGLLGHRLRRRARRPRGRPHPDDRRPGDPVPGGPGAHDARRRVRQPPRLRDHAGRLRGDPRATARRSRSRPPPRVTEELAQTLRGGHALPTLPADARGRACSTRSCRSSPRSCARSIPTTRAAPGTSSGRCSTCSTPSAAAAAIFDDARALRAPLRSRSCAPACARSRRTASPTPAVLSIDASRTSSRRWRCGCRCPARRPTASSRPCSIVGKLSHRPDTKVATRRARLPGGLPDGARPLRADGDGHGPRPGARPRVARASRRASQRARESRARSRRSAARRRRRRRGRRRRGRRPPVVRRGVGLIRSGLITRDRKSRPDRI